MDKHDEEAIRERAYALWVEAGSPDGDDQRFWHEAERQLGKDSELKPAEDADLLQPPRLQAGLPNL